MIAFACQSEELEARGDSLDDIRKEGVFGDPRVVVVMPWIVRNGVEYVQSTYERRDVGVSA